METRTLSPVVRRPIQVRARPMPGGLVGNVAVSATCPVADDRTA